jgi:hypothetical protein
MCFLLPINSKTNGNSQSDICGILFYARIGTPRFGTGCADTPFKEDNGYTYVPICIVVGVCRRKYVQSVQPEREADTTASW